MAAMSLGNAGSLGSHSLLASASDRDESPASGSFSLDSLLGALKTPAHHPPKPDQRLEYLFEDEYVANGPSWGARICYGAGITYLTGLAVGGTWGLLDGLRNPAGITRRLRINCIMNACTARGPFVANNIAMLALLYNLIHGGVIKLRDGRYDLASSVASAAAAGIIYKSTRGVRAMGVAGGIFGSGMLAYQLAKKYYHEHGSLLL